MADVIKEVVETATEAGMDVKVMEPTIEGPTIFKTSNTAKIVFGVVVITAATYGVIKGVKCVMNKKGLLKKDSKVIDISEDIDAEDVNFNEVDLDEEV